MYNVLNNFYNMFNFDYRTDDNLWLNWFVTKFRANVQPYLNNQFDANLVLTHSPKDVKNTNQISKLYLGSFPASLCPDELKKKNITHILSLVDIYPVYPEFFDYKIIPYRDSVNENLFQDDKLKKALEYVEKTLSEGHNILVHCFFGKSRSSSIVIAYMIKNLGYTYDQALNMVKQNRTIAQPNKTFEYQLRFYETVVKGLDKSWLIIFPDDYDFKPFCEICGKEISNNTKTFWKNKIYHNRCLEK